MRFTAHQLDSIDPSDHKKRVDFIVHRCDGFATRLHPHQSKLKSSGRYEAAPVHGRLKDWLIGASPPKATDSTQSTGVAQVVVAEAIPQFDRLSRRDGRLFLDRLKEQKECKLGTVAFEGNMGMVEFVDLTDGQFFPWWKWAINLPKVRDQGWGRGEILRFGAAWHADIQAFMFVAQREDNSWVTIQNNLSDVKDGLDSRITIPASVLTQG